MSKNYFSIERNGQCWTPVILADRNGNPAFEEFLDMSYDEMKNSARLGDFIMASMNAADTKSGTADEQTVVTLIGDDNVFIWGIIMGPDPEQEHDVRFNLVDWKKDGKSYRYEP